MTSLLQRATKLRHMTLLWRKRPLERTVSSFSVRNIRFDTLNPMKQNNNNSKYNNNNNKRLPAGRIVGDHMKAAGERVAQSHWVQIDSIPPTSSLEAVLQGITTALEKESQRGIADLDAPWDPVDPVPSLNSNNNSSDEWIQKAVVNLSTLARPTGWFIQLQNRSLAQALMNQANDSGLWCAWKRVVVTEPREQHAYYNVSDATIRVENCPPKTPHIQVMNLFSRYDLKTVKPVEAWKGRNDDKSMTFLVHFSDASWARSALREKQGEFMNSNKLLLVQFPRQIT